MAIPESRPSKVYVYGESDATSLWYCIDLESLPYTNGELSPVPTIDFAREGDWTLVGDYIYWTGGYTEVKERLPGGRVSLERRASKELRRYNITTGNWEPALSSMKVPRFNPRVFALGGNKIFVLGGKLSFHKNDCEDIERFGGEVYDIGTKNWGFVALNLQDFAFPFSCDNTALVRDKKGEPNEVVFYSLGKLYLLFYDVHRDAFKLELHPNFACMPSSEGLDRSSLVSLHILLRLVRNAIPVVRDSTLYWFTYDLRLYGYDFVQQRWFKSRRLDKELRCWELWDDKDYPWGLFPLLVDLYNGEFMLFLPTLSGKLVIAFLFVSQSKPNSKPNEFLDVTVNLVRTLASSESNFCPRNGMSILKNNRSTG